MKKVLAFSLVLFMSLLIISACSSSSDDETELIISHWGFNEDLLQENLFKPFEEEHNVKIVLDTGNNADRLNAVRQGTSQIDLIFLAENFAIQGIEEGLFEEINRDHIPNIENLYDVAQAPLGESYGPAYTVGQFGIIYDTSVTDNPVSSWSDLWRDEFANELSIPEITTTAGPMVLDFAAKHGGASDLDAELAFQQLDNLKPNVVRVYSRSSDLANMFSQGEISIAASQDFSFGTIQEAVPTAVWVTPEEGSYAITNTVNIVKGSENVELAEKFIDFLLSEEVQKANALDRVDSPANKLVELTEEEAEGLTYGAEIIDNLQTLDWSNVNENLDAWIDRWNREFAN